MSRCPNCQTLNETTANYCKRCGTPLRRNAPLKGQCPQCHNYVDLDSVFCPYCGLKLKQICSNCGSPQSSTAKYCIKCGHQLNPIIITSAKYLPSTFPTIKNRRYFAPTTPNEAPKDANLTKLLRNWIFVGFILSFLFFAITYFFTTDWLLSLAVFFTFLPTVAFWTFFKYLKDFSKPVPFLQKMELSTVKYFFTGVLASIPIAIVELVGIVGVALIMAFFSLLFGISNDFLLLLAILIMVSMVEEFGKYLIIKRLVNPYKISVPVQGIAVGVVGVLGFATAENIGYILGTLVESGAFAALGVGIVRMLLSVPMHILTATIIGYYYMFSLKHRFFEDQLSQEVIEFSSEKQPTTGKYYLGIPILLHTAFNLSASFIEEFLFQISGILVFVSLLVLMMAIFYGLYYYIRRLWVLRVYTWEEVPRVLEYHQYHAASRNKSFIERQPNK